MIASQKFTVPTKVKRASGRRVRNWSDGEGTESVWGCGERERGYGERVGSVESVREGTESVREQKP
jgi:hypothetical protein